MRRRGGGGRKDRKGEREKTNRTRYEVREGGREGGKLLKEGRKRNKQERGGTT